jgi:hypothetical protein
MSGCNRSASGQGTRTAQAPLHTVPQTASTSARPLSLHSGTMFLIVVGNSFLGFRRCVFSMIYCGGYGWKDELAPPDPAGDHKGPPPISTTALAHTDFDELFSG